MKARKTNYSISRLLALTVLALCTACFCSSCSCCYCTGTCQCEQGGQNELDNLVAGACTIDHQCTAYCQEHKLGPVVSANPTGFGCYESDCAASIALLPEGDPRLTVLRKFRDTVLTRSSAGRAILDLYERNEQGMAEFLEGHPSLKKPALAIIDGLVAVLEKLMNS